jgi:hypothetical protein
MEADRQLSMLRFSLCDSRLDTEFFHRRPRNLLRIERIDNPSAFLHSQKFLEKISLFSA